ncbi:hypothetical protein BamIOP4010DRAFT_3584 [Burkholderia ambifaria IOP40-10]|uniref:Uncharacterized protein n=1 Tax=Burkholderia ambifaria IOP40-10 TaxID=396596 RepID=B1FHS4_9BURK|nr:hypothetical protein BamIOP4010DRAFT_3584 [Burkholderia ambifaria IOP40-10]
MHDVAHAAHRRERVAVLAAQRAQLGPQIDERAADGRRGLDPERGREPLVDCLDATARVERDHAVAQVLQQVVEALTAKRLGVGRVRDFERRFDRLAHRRVRIQEHRAHAGTRREIGDEAGADDRLDAAIVQVVHAGFRFLRGLI